MAEGAHYIELGLNNYSTNPFSDLKLLFQFFRLNRKYQFDHIFHYTIKPNVYGSIAAKLAGIDHHLAITTGLGRMFRFEHWFTQYISVGLYKMAAWCTDEVWFLNQNDQDVFVKMGIAPLEKCKVIPSEGIDTQKFRSIKKYKESPITRFLFAGRLLKEKGIEEYVEAAKIIKERYAKVRFEVLGYLDERNSDSIKGEQIKKWQQEGIIKYLGSTEDVRPYLDRADCVIFPSYYQEGISRILMESASMFTPTITTDNVGCSDIVVHNWNGFLCEQKSIDSLVDRIQEFLALNYKERFIMGNRSRELIKKKFSEEQIIGIYHQCVEQALWVTTEKA